MITSSQFNAVSDIELQDPDTATPQLNRRVLPSYLRSPGLYNRRAASPHLPLRRPPQRRERLCGALCGADRISGPAVGVRTQT